MPYIDALFLSTAGTTQAGLSTLDLNTLRLWQQISLYFIAMITTPIFIHTGVVFLRLYFYERFFDNIKEKSRLQHKMRKSTTLAARTKSNQNNNNNDIDIENGLNNEKQDNSFGGFFRSLSLRSGTKTYNNSTNEKEKDIKISKNTTNINNYNNSEKNFPDDSDSTAVETTQKITASLNSESPAAALGPNNNIKFGELPKPQKRNEDIDPRDMIRSITMLQFSKKYNNDVDGPALVIKGPQERDREQEEKKSWSDPKSKLERLEKRLNNKKDTLPKFLTDMKMARRTSSGVSSSSNNAHELFNIESVANSSDTGDSDSDADEDEDEDEEAGSDFDGVTRTQSNIALPSKDQTGGSKFNKRSNTIEGETNRSMDKGIKLTQASTLDRFVRSQLRKRKKRLKGKSKKTGASRSNSMRSSNSNNPPHLTRQMSTNYLSWNPTVGRNSTFYDLSSIQKEELGGVEYRAVKLLAILLIGYYVIFHLIGLVCMVAWIASRSYFENYIGSVGVSPAWWAIFLSMSSFTDLGFSLAPDSMVSFNKSAFVLLVSGILIILGNTGFPILLRFIIWFLTKISRYIRHLTKSKDDDEYFDNFGTTQLGESLGFLLDHPRRCFTLLFPSSETWWLFFVLISLNVFDLALFLILDFHADLLEGIPRGYKFLDGLYQAIATRTAGFTVVDLSQIHPAIQVSYMLMMYVSVMPLAISIRRTNVYEEQSLGVYYDPEDDEPEGNSKKNFITSHLRRQLSFDLWYIFLGLFVICLADGGKLEDTTKGRFNSFAVLFEVVSAYCNVGLSLGYPGINSSFCTEFSTISKLVLIAMMIRGKHRGLPYSLDRAVMFPSENMERRDDVQAHHELRRTATQAAAAIISQAQTDEKQQTNTDVGTDSSGIEDNIRPMMQRRDSLKRNFKKLVRNGSSALVVGGHGTSLKKYGASRTNESMHNTSTPHTHDYTISSSSAPTNLQTINNNAPNTYPQMASDNNYLNVTQTPITISTPYPQQSAIITNNPYYHRDSLTNANTIANALGTPRSDLHPGTGNDYFSIPVRSRSPLNLTSNLNTTDNTTKEEHNSTNSNSNSNSNNNNDNNTNFNDDNNNNSHGEDPSSSRWNNMTLNFDLESKDKKKTK